MLVCEPQSCASQICARSCVCLCVCVCVCVCHTCIPATSIVCIKSTTCILSILLSTSSSVYLCGTRVHTHTHTHTQAHKNAK